MVTRSEGMRRVLSMVAFECCPTLMATVSASSIVLKDSKGTSTIESSDELLRIDKGVEQRVAFILSIEKGMSM
jgi:hypothetical protein